MSDPVDFTVARVHALHEGDVVRVECRDGTRLLVSIDLRTLDFADALMEGKVVTSALTIWGKT